MSEKNINLKLNVWRQKNSKATGAFEVYQAKDISTHMSFLEMLDVVNEKLNADGKDPIAFDHDCREGICGACGVVIDGVPHGGQHRTTTCQLHMRQFKDGAEVWIEPWRASGFPVIKDLAVDRGAFDRIIQSGGYISVNTGSARDANETRIPKKVSDRAMDAAECIGCGACVAACPNASAMLFVSAKVSHLGLLPQGEAEADDRVRKMVSQHDAEGFGACTNTGECEAACPKGISIDFIARTNKEFVKAMLTAPDDIESREG
jgi:succinate dehydrogenase / fumarate reductase iron-sulfur subunit